MDKDQRLAKIYDIISDIQAMMAKPNPDIEAARSQASQIRVMGGKARPMSEEWRLLYQREQKIPEIIKKKRQRQTELLKIVKGVDEDIKELQAELKANELKLQALTYDGDGPER